jgi:hypothetical protein
MFRLVGKFLLASAMTWATQAFVRAVSERTQRRRERTRHDSQQLANWEDEGGNPAPRRVAVS